MEHELHGIAPITHFRGDDVSESERWDDPDLNALLVLAQQKQMKLEVQQQEVQQSNFKVDGIGQEGQKADQVLNEAISGLADAGWIFLACLSGIAPLASAILVAGVAAVPAVSKMIENAVQKKQSVSQILEQIILPLAAAGGFCTLCLHSKRGNKQKEWRPILPEIHSMCLHRLER